jgi:hypothetical protein
MFYNYNSYSYYSYDNSSGMAIVGKIVRTGITILKTLVRKVVLSAKSGHMRFVHSRCKLGLFLGGYALDSRCDFRGIIEPGEFVLPWSIFLHVLLDILHHIAKTFPFMVPYTLVVHVAERPLNRVGTRTSSRTREIRGRIADPIDGLLGHF